MLERHRKLEKNLSRFSTNREKQTLLLGVGAEKF